jgi:serine/threonine protein kinase
LLKEVGRGAKGIVYLARDARQRPVAIKILREPSDLESRRRFRRESALASSVNHPNIVAVHDALRTRNIAAIVMEYVPGKSLDQLIPPRGLPCDICLHYALQMARALTAVHNAGMVHRDLKPRNFAVTKSGVVKLLDFGLAKRVRTSGVPRSCRDSQQPETRFGTILGTAGYMSPEQVLGHPATPRSDIFSFGALFYEMLTGRGLFRDNREYVALEAILHKRTVKLPARIPRRIARIVKRCVAKEPARRYSCGGELVTDLERLVKPA